MKQTFTFFLLGLFALPLSVSGQEYQQFFDGADTLYGHNSSWPPNSLLIEVDPDSNNIWQIGAPQKTLFSAAATAPNAIVTDTLNTYPVNNQSSFQYTVVPWATWGILAIQWVQMVDMDTITDGGMVEISFDNGQTWENIAGNPYTYNYYGFLPGNLDTLSNGELGLTGSDTTWRNVWLCYDMSFLSSQTDSITIRHTFLSDSIESQKDGWMMDNFYAHMTLIHTVNKVEESDYLTIGPNPTTGIVNIDIQKINEFHIIEHMELTTLDGRVVQQWANIPTKFFIDIGDYPNGIYFLTVRTNKQQETVKIVLEK